MPEVDREERMLINGKLIVAERHRPACQFRLRGAFVPGASLARLETRVAFEEFLKRFPDFGFDETGVERHYSSNVRGLARLPLLIERSATV
jgi:hypothetical protein